MSCPADCPVCNGPEPDHGIQGDDLATQVFILKERLMDERHKSYRLECELAEVEAELERLEEVLCPSCERELKHP